MMSTYTCMLISESTAVSSSFFFFFNDTATTEIYTLSLHDALPISVAAAVEIQRALRAQTWPADVPIRVRMAIHTGEAGADYRGPHVNRAARLRAIAHGEQILISGVTAGILRDALPAGASLIDLGRHRLRDLSELEH